MKFKEALAQILQTESAEKTSDAFYLYSRLSDLCTSFEGREKVNLLFEVDKRLHVIENFKTEGKSAAPILRAAYPAVAEVLPLDSYVMLIACVEDILYPKPVIAAPAAPKTAAQATMIEWAPPEEETQTKTPLGPRKKKKSQKVWTVLGIVGGIWAVIAGCVCLGLFANWTVWQYIIGALGGLVLFAIAAFVTFILEDECVEAYKVAPFFALFFAIVNFVLFCIFRGDYKVIFIFISVYCLLALPFLIIYAFDDVEWGWGIVIIVETLLLVIAFILGLVFVR